MAETTDKPRPEPPYKLERELMARRDILPAAKLVWSCVRDRQGRKRFAWPSHASIARDTGMSIATVKRSVAQLERAGLLEITATTGKTCQYVVADLAQIDLGQNELGQNDPGQSDLPTQVKMSYPLAQNELRTLFKNPTHGTLLNTEAPKRKTRPKIELDWEARTWTGISDEDWAAWSAAYPAVDARTDVLRALEWCLSNPAKGRKSNYRRFLTGWLSRTQDGGGTRQAPPTAPGRCQTPAGVNYEQHAIRPATA